MKPRFALLAAAVLTTFVLVLAGAIVSRLAQPSPAELAAAADSGVTAVPTADAQATATARDELYQQQLAEAAARIAQANQQLEQAYGQPSAPAAPQPAPADQPPADQPPPPAAPAAPSYAVSPDQAAAIALSAAPGATLLATPELVDFSGAIAYEVRLDRGLAYVDANSGAILSNSAVAPPPAAPAAQPPAAPAAPAAPPAAEPPPPALIGGEQATAVAQAYVGGGAIKEVRLDEEDGVTVYEVRFESGSRVYVDAYNGRVIYAKTEDRSDNSGSGGDDDDK